MESQLEKLFKEKYLPLIEYFVKEIRSVKMKGLPEPFIPVFGRGYESSPFKIAFVGWETRNNSSLSDFYTDANENPEDVLYNFYDVIDATQNFPFLSYGNNFGTSFWDFILKFLARFYSVGNWKQLKNYSNVDVNKILQSFVWGNVESIERFSVSAEDADGDYESWKKVKEASKIFDKSELILEIFKPQVIILLHWEADEKWLGDYSVDEDLSENLQYYLLNNNTHLFWTKHPIRMSFEKIDADEIIDKILQTFINKNIFPSFPGEQYFKSQIK